MDIFIGEQRKDFVKLCLNWKGRIWKTSEISIHAAMWIGNLTDEITLDR